MLLQVLQSVVYIFATATLCSTLPATLQLKLFYFKLPLVPGIIVLLLLVNIAVKNFVQVVS
jgi:hypothetical protein